jgi:putative transposase
LAEARLVDALLGKLREKCLSSSFDIYAYCLMPDHLHLEAVGLAPHSDLIALMRQFKGAATSVARGLGVSDLWQKGFYDHVLRERDDENAVAWYIFNNPVRKGLVKDMCDWVFSGSWMFDWRKMAAPLGEFVPPWKKVAALAR